MRLLLLFSLSLYVPVCALSAVSKCSLKQLSRGAWHDTQHNKMCRLSLFLLGLGVTFFGEIFEVSSPKARNDVVEQHSWQKQQERNLFSKTKKGKILRWREKRNNIHLVVKTSLSHLLSFCIHTHTEFLTLISHTMATFSAAKVRMQRNSFLLALVCCSRRRFPPAFSPDALFFSANRKWMCA